MSGMTFSLNDYRIPQWSALPLYKSYFQVIKNGTFVENLNIRNKQFHLIGRLEDLCDVYIDNPTVSRKHAILQYKREDQYPYLYDLGSAHGTEVNHKKLPQKVYQKISPFDTIKFGVSSKMYIYRCPELQAQIQQEQNKGPEEDFVKILEQRNKKLSQSQLKQKYLQMLENDPCFAANNLVNTRNFKSGNRGGASRCEGVDWGIGDEYEVYAYKNEQQFQIQPDLIRRLPGIDQNQLNKISQYEMNLRKYQQIEQSLNQLRNKERNEYGLEQNQRDKKQKLEKRYVEALQALEKTEFWIRTHIFGDDTNQHKKHEKHRKIRETDSFGDDQFLDRTLATKKDKKQSNNQENNKRESESSDIFTTKDYWKLDKELRSLLKQLIQLEEQQKKLNTIQEQNESSENEADELDQFMKENEGQLAIQDIQLKKHIRANLQEKINKIKQQLKQIIGTKQIQRIEDEERGVKPKKIVSEDRKRKIKEEEEKKKIDKILSELEEMRKKAEEIDQNDVRIFQAYKQEAALEEELEHEKSGITDKRQRNEDDEIEMKQYEAPIVKGPKWKIDRDLQEDEDYVDLTKRFK